MDEIDQKKRYTKKAPKKKEPKQPKDPKIKHNIKFIKGPVYIFGDLD